MAVPATLSLDRYSKLVLTALTVLCGMIVIELWAERPCMLAPAAAQVPDSGLQRRQQLDEVKRTNDLLARILDHLENRSISVKLQDSGKTAELKGGRKP